jgi:hypothetical protein
MLAFVEIIRGPVGFDQLPAHIGSKVRLPEAVVPGRPFMTRPAGYPAEGAWGEGLVPDAAVEAFGIFWERFRDDPNWLVHSVWNEPNHPDHVQYWAERGGLDGAERALFEAVDRIASIFGQAAIGKLGLGGLMIPADLDPWIAIYDRAQRRYPAIQRCANVYWEGTADREETQRRINDAIWDGLRQLGHRPGWVAEFNDSSATIGVAERVANCQWAVAHMASRGTILGACLFAHDRWADANGVEFGYSLDEQAAVFAAIAPPFR